MARWWQLLILVVAGTAIVAGCIAAARTGDGDRKVEVPPIPFVGPPAPVTVDIDQDSLAGQIVAKLEARLQVMLSAVANVASGNTTYYGWGAAGIAGFAWFVQLLTTRRFAQLAEMNVKLSHEREMRRIECNIAHGKED